MIRQLIGRNVKRLTDCLLWPWRLTGPADSYAASDYWKAARA